MTLNVSFMTALHHCTSVDEKLKCTYFGPRCKEKIFPSLFLGLIQNSARSCSLADKNGIEPTIGRERIAGGNLRPLLVTLCRP